MLPKTLRGKKIDFWVGFWFLFLMIAINGDIQKYIWVKHIYMWWLCSCLYKWYSHIQYPIFMSNGNYFSSWQVINRFFCCPFYALSLVAPLKHQFISWLNWYVFSWLAPPLDVICIIYIPMFKWYILCSDHGGTGSLFSGDKSFDEPPWGTYDTNDDVDSVWGFNAISTSKVCKFYTIFIEYSI